MADNLNRNIDKAADKAKEFVDKGKDKAEEWTLTGPVDGTDEKGQTFHHEGDMRGIPDSNPSHQPNDDDQCDKGDTEVKTTPSGVQVVVPCQAANNEH